MKPLYSPLSSEFRRKRTQSGLSQSGLADLLGVHVNSIKGYESGRVHCSHITWGFMCYRLEERRQQLLIKLEELNRRRRSRVWRSNFLRKAMERFGE